MAIGVASVLLTSGAGAGAREEVGRSLGSMATDLITVRPAQVARLAARRTVTGAVTTLRPEDAAAIAALPSVAAVAPVAETRGAVKADSATTNASIRGVAPQYLALRRFRLARGRLLDEADARASARVAVLGARVAGSLFPGGDAVGHAVRLKRVPFEVVGVLAPRGASADGADEDAFVAIPLTTALRRVLNQPSLSSIAVTPRGSPRAAEEEMRALLRRRHRLEARNAPDDFDIQGQDRVGAMRRTAARSLGLLSAGLAGVGLAVGAAGILALMLLSVKERTAEIGVRMAVGARPADILLQFLGEAALLAIAGGAAGALLGSAGAVAVRAATGWKVAVPALAYLAALGTSLATGLLSGALPAWMASRVPPIEALASR